MLSSMCWPGHVTLSFSFSVENVICLAECIGRFGLLGTYRAPKNVPTSWHMNSETSHCLLFHGTCVGVRDGSGFSASMMESYGSNSSCQACQSSLSLLSPLASPSLRFFIQHQKCLIQLSAVTATRLGVGRLAFGAVLVWL